uniref:tRNA(Ile)-lysidine synthase n=1 Tax=Gelidium kathyanniae TaxID=2483893 RepID=A0A3G2QXW4_9FLOR|nr:tRNA(Ile)-lysidine synthase [Gelidium kathyanniae]AYO27923.1 tRNA(Ile)-lysidine synthase [Gelidium kathyanniae]
MMIDLYKKFRNSFHEQIKLTPKLSIVVAISGGQDSICLIKLIESIKRTKYLLKVEYIYIDHQWKEDSKYHIDHLINLVNSFKQKISIYQIKSITSSEYKARTIRYQILTKHALTYNYNTIITAHTNTDKIETFFQLLLRGSSLEGITSLNVSNQLTQGLFIFRPLVRASRLETACFCRNFSLPIWSDSSNYNYNTYRNRIRYEIIPYLNQYFGTQIINNLLSFLSIANIENEYIKQNALKLYLIARHHKYVALNYKLIKKQHNTIQIRTLYIFFYHNFNKILSKEIMHTILYHFNNHSNYIRIINWHELKINLYFSWLYIN